jgi:hypothetical protein
MPRATDKSICGHVRINETFDGLSVPHAPRAHHCCYCDAYQFATIAIAMTDQREQINFWAIFGTLLSVTGIGLGICLPPFAAISLAGLVVSGFGLTQQAQRGLAITGVVLGLFGSLFGLISLLLGI